MWLVVHIGLLIDLHHRRMVLRNRLWTYFTNERSARLIAGDAQRISTTMHIDEGKALLRMMYRNGVALLAANLLLSGIVAEISAEPAD